MVKTKFFKFSKIIFLFCLFLPISISYSQEHNIAGVFDSQNILPEKKRARLVDEWLKWRLDNILPNLMRREGIDMWLVINREWNEDPVFLSLVPSRIGRSPGCVILIFHDRGKERGVEKFIHSPHGMGTLYKATWTSRKKTQFASLAEFIKKRNPKKIGINVSSRWGYGDGLTASLRDDLIKALGAEYSSRLISAGDLCVRWLETRSPQELSVYRHICRIAHDIIREAFSDRVIIPDFTTINDVIWWMKQKCTDIGVGTWFKPYVSIRRHRKNQIVQYDGYDPNGKGRQEVIRRGDLLHCDLGIKYLGLTTDMQWWAYVCKIGEDDAPPGLKQALRGSIRLAEILMSEFKEGKSGREIAQAAMSKAKAEGLRPLIWVHPVGVHGHGAGCFIDARPSETTDERNVLRLDYPLYANTCYAIELGNTTSIPEWDNQDLRIDFEEDAVFTKEECKYIDGYQSRYLLIK